jgi:NAD(P)-dependent dehydrogenase (short-subunit alcohol dehydrogenase family)
VWSELRAKIMYRAKPEDGVAFVTGASSGIGRATALELARRGYRVAVTARRGEELEQLVASAPEQIFAYPADVTNGSAMGGTVFRIEREVGPIALAFLNAGVFLPGERVGFDAALIAQTHEVNVGGTVNCIAPLLAAMMTRGRGQIAINASLAGYNGLPGNLAYGSSKAALIHMAEALMLTYQSKGLAFQVLCHGFVRTAMTDQETDFAMPWRIEPEAAATIICNGFEKSGFEIAFPWPLVAATKFVRLLPYPLRFRLIAAALRKAERDRTPDIDASSSLPPADGPAKS